MVWMLLLHIYQTLAQMTLVVILVIDSGGVCVIPWDMHSIRSDFLVKRRLPNSDNNGGYDWFSCIKNYCLISSVAETSHLSSTNNIKQLQGFLTKPGEIPKNWNHPFHPCFQCSSRQTGQAWHTGRVSCQNHKGALLELFDILTRTLTSSTLNREGVI